MASRFAVRFERRLSRAMGKLAVAVDSTSALLTSFGKDPPEDFELRMVEVQKRLEEIKQSSEQLTSDHDL